MQVIDVAGHEATDPAAAARRLEAALDRIAQLASQPRPDAEEAPGPDLSGVASRLDRLIAQLRGVLDEPAPGTQA